MPDPQAVEAHPEKQSSFYWGFLFLSKDKRRALADVYGFCRYVDDIVDAGNLSKEEAQRLLDFWQEEIGRMYEGRPTHAMARLLIPHVRQYHLPKQAFLDLIAGVGMDLRKSRYETFEELEPYLHGVAVAVGQLCVEIFGYRHTTAAGIREYAKNMGYAFQLTNILRDVGSDLERGRIYLPVQEIAAAGYSVESLIRREHTPAFCALMDSQYERAKKFYAHARNALHPLDRPSMVAAEVMAGVYEEVLERIKESGYHVFFHRVGLPGWRKAQLALKGWLHCYGIF